MSKGKVITSISEGDSDPGTFIPELIEHFLGGRFPIDKMVKRYAFDEIETAFSDLHDAKVLKPVLIMGS
jgi:aryl-alcohol dehydrogenase